MPNKPKIWVDLDDTLADFYRPFLNWFNEKNGTNHKFDETHDYEVSKYLGCTPEDTHFMMRDFILKKSHLLQPYENSKEVIKYIKNKVDLIIITARTEDVRWVSQYWLETHFWKDTFKDTYFLGNHLDSEHKATKAEICIQEGIMLLIDDSLKNISQCTSNGVNTILYDKPWNRKHILKHISNVERAKNWYEILGILMSKWYV